MGNYSTYHAIIIYICKITKSVVKNGQKWISDRDFDPDPARSSARLSSSNKRDGSEGKGEERTKGNGERER